MTSSPNDTVAGTSFALMVPGSGQPPVPTYADLVRVGAADTLDEQSLPVDPNTPKGTTFAGDKVTQPFSDGAVSYTIGSLQFVGPEGYLRVGAAGSYEAWLTTDAENPKAPTKPTDTTPTQPFGGNGIVLHGQAQITCFAPSITNTAQSITNSTDSISTYSNSSFSAVYSSTNRIGVLSSQTKGAGDVLTNANYSVVDNLSSVIGNSVTTVGGSMATVWAGADASTGIGSLLWSNFGITENLFGGSIVNIINGAVDLQGWGETKLSDFDVVAPSEIKLAVAPLAAVTTLSGRALGLSQKLAMVGGTLNGALVAAMELGIGVYADHKDDDQSALQDALEVYKGLMYAVTGLTAGLQIACMAAGRAFYIMKSVALDEKAASIDMQNGLIQLRAGGTIVTINGQGFAVDAGDPVANVLDTTNMATVTLSGPAVLANQAPFVGAVGDPGEMGANIAPLPTKTISFTTLGAFEVSALSVQFTLPG